MPLDDSDKKIIGVISEKAAAKTLPTKKKARYLNFDDTVNIEGIRSGRTEEDGEIVLCSSKKTELFFLTKDGNKRAFHAHGACKCCDKMFSYEALHTIEGSDYPSTPSELVGAFCRDCYKLDDYQIDKILEERGAEYRLGPHPKV